MSSTSSIQSKMSPSDKPPLDPHSKDAGAHRVHAFKKPTNRLQARFRSQPVNQLSQLGQQKTLALGKALQPVATNQPWIAEDEVKGPPSRKIERQERIWKPLDGQEKLSMKGPIRDKKTEEIAKQLGFLSEQLEEEFNSIKKFISDQPAIHQKLYEEREYDYPSYARVVVNMQDFTKTLKDKIKKEQRFLDEKIKEAEFKIVEENEALRKLEIMSLYKEALPQVKQEIKEVKKDINISKKLIKKLKKLRGSFEKRILIEANSIKRDLDKLVRESLKKDYQYVFKQIFNKVTDSLKVVKKKAGIATRAASHTVKEYFKEFSSFIKVHLKELNHLFAKIRKYSVFLSGEISRLAERILVLAKSRIKEKAPLNKEWDSRL